MHERKGQSGARKGQVEAVEEDSDVASGSLTKPLEGLIQAERHNFWSSANAGEVMLSKTRSMYSHLFRSEQAEAPVARIFFGRVHEPLLGASEAEPPRWLRWWLDER